MNTHTIPLNNHIKWNMVLLGPRSGKGAILLDAHLFTNLYHEDMTNIMALDMSGINTRMRKKRI